MIKNRMKIQDTNNGISKGVSLAFPLVGNPSDSPLEKRAKGVVQEGFRTLQKDGGQASRNDGQRMSGSRNLQSPICNEKGIALVMILILAAIALLIMAGLLFMITSSTQISGMQKRYKTALEAGKGGAEITYQFIALRGNDADNTTFKTLLSSVDPQITTPSGCSGNDMFSVPHTGLEAKLNAPTTNWSAGCDKTMSINPAVATSYDFKYELGSVGYPTYTVYAKIVDTVEGNSAPDKGLGGKGVVTSGSGEVPVASMPYLYTMEVDAQNKDNSSERSKLSILYQY
jgi:hypothetical protein